MLENHGGDRAVAAVLKPREFQEAIDEAARKIRYPPRRGSPKGKRGPRDAERRRWWLLALKIGWKAARAEHKAQGGKYAEWKQIQRHRVGTDKS